MATCLPLNLAAYPWQRGGQRPALSGLEHVTASDDSRFAVHYTFTGEDATDPTDDDGDGVPDVVSRVLAALEVGAEAYDRGGYRPLERDAGQAGTSAIDLYLRRIDANGYAFPTIARDEDAVSSCYMEVMPTLAEVGTTLESVVVHELHHCVQFAYTLETDDWLYESTATWEQYRLVQGPELDLALGVLWTLRIAEPHRPLDDTGDRFEYAGFLFPKFWAEYRGFQPARVPELWEALAEAPAWTEGLNLAGVRAWGQELDGVFLEHATWNAFACARDDGAHYRDEDAACRVDVSAPVEPISAGVAFDVEHPRGGWTASYHELEAGGDDRPAQLVCSAPGEDEVLGMRLVALDAEGVAEEQVGRIGEPGAAIGLRLLDPIDPAGRVLVVLTSTGPGPLRSRCTLERVEPAVGGACSAVPGGRAGGWAGLAALALALGRRRYR